MIAHSFRTSTRENNLSSPSVLNVEMYPAAHDYHLLSEGCSGASVSLGNFKAKMQWKQ